MTRPASWEQSLIRSFAALAATSQHKDAVDGFADLESWRIRFVDSAAWVHQDKLRGISGRDSICGTLTLRACTGLFEGEIATLYLPLRLPGCRAIVSTRLGPCSRCLPRLNAVGHRAAFHFECRSTGSGAGAGHSSLCHRSQPCTAAASLVANRDCNRKD